MANPFFDHPILNSPYECPQRHWELDTKLLIYGLFQKGRVLAQDGVV